MFPSEMIPYRDEYISYLRAFSAVRNRARFEFPMRFDDYASACAEEDEQELRDRSSHVSHMRWQGRYL